MFSPRLKLLVKLGLVAGPIAGISLFLHLHTADEMLTHVLCRELYFLPIILATFWFGLKGGLAASLSVSALFLPLVLSTRPDPPVRQVADLLEVGLLNLVALVLGLMRDRQLRQQSQAQRAKALAAVAQAVASVAHDMKTPLMAIGGFSTQMRRALDPSHPAAHKLGVVISQTARLESLVRDMLDFARPLELKQAPVDLAGLASECLELAAPVAQQGQVELTMEGDQPPRATSLDPYRVQQALLNLVTNAVQASPPGRRVTLCLRHQGLGIPRSQREQVLHPFFTTKKEGTGLGLPIAKKIAEAHGGRLLIGDNQPQGMVFSLVLPLPPPQAPAAGGA